MNDLVICLQARARDGGVTYSLRSPRRRPLEGGPSSSGDCRARPWHPVGVSLHLVVSLETLAHKRLPIVALEGLGARVGVARLHLLLLGHRGRLTLALEAGGHERFALVALLVASLRVARLHALLLRVRFLLLGGGGYRERSCYTKALKRFTDAVGTDGPCSAALPHPSLPP